MRHLNKIEEYIAAGLLAAMALLNFGNVLSRYILHSSWSFTGELLLIMFVWVIMLGSAIAYKRYEHLGLPLVVDSMPRKWRIIPILISGIVSCVLIMALVISGYAMVEQQVEFDQVTSVLALPEWTAGLAIPLGAVFILFRIIESTVRDIRKLRLTEEVQ